jgi:hypothetical protein
VFRKNRHASVIFRLRPAGCSRKSPLTEAEEKRKRGTEATESGGADHSDDNLEARRQVRQKFWCAACFVSALFETDCLMKGYAGGLGASASDRSISAY